MCASVVVVKTPCKYAIENAQKKVIFISLQERLESLVPRFLSQALLVKKETGEL